jgi:hypothetical protein
VGLFLVGGTASAQNWVPSTSPYGTWRQPAQASKPAPSSWREDAKPAADSGSSKDATVPMPPPPPIQQQTSQSSKDLGTLPPLLPPQSSKDSLSLPPPQSSKDSLSLPPLPPPPAPAEDRRSQVAPIGHEAEESEQLPRQPPATPYTIRRTEYQPPAGLTDDRRSTEERLLEQAIQLEPPGPDRIFRLESEAALNERIRQEGKTKTPPEKFTFPDEPVVSREPYPGRHWPPQTEYAEPNYLCYGRLLFEDKNTERYGWDLGILQPVVSAGAFFADVVTLPYHVGTAPCRCYECNSGLCLPGDPVPYLLYPPELSLTGAVTEGAAIGAIFAIFP